MEIYEGSQEQEIEWQAQVMNHMYGRVDSAVLKCALELGIFDTIHNSDKPMITLPELVSSSSSLASSKPENLRRLLRYLAKMNLITITIVEGNDVFSLTDTSKYLLRDQEKSLADWALMITDEILMALWHELSSACSSSVDGPTSCEKVNGLPCYELTDKHTKVNHLINNGMSSDTKMLMPAFIKGCEEVLNGITSLIDIGGGIGTAMSYVVKAFPHIKCTIFELPQVVAETTPCAGVDLVGGDMFKSIPPADAIFMKYILHNFEDGDCIKILEKCKEAIPADGGKVIIVDIVLDQDPEEDNYDLVRARLSLDMDMIGTGGKERTKDEWKKLFKMAGFSNYEIIPIPAIQSVIVAYP